MLAWIGKSYQAPSEDEILWVLVYPTEQSLAVRRVEPINKDTASKLKNSVL